MARGSCRRVEPGSQAAYRLMGAGEKMARAAEARKLQPTLVTFALAAICAVYLARTLAFPLLKPRFPENSQTFWLVSSGMCLVIGLVHLYGLISQWSVL